MRKNLIIAGLITFLLAACPQNSNQSPMVGIEYCKMAQANLENLGCISKTKPYTAKGKSFEQFCQDTMSNGIDLAAKCLAEIKDCSKMNSCVQGQK